MDVVVVGKHTEVDAALRALTVEKVERVTKFANDVRRVDVDYEQHPTRRAETRTRARSSCTCASIS